MKFTTNYFKFYIQCITIVILTLTLIGAVFQTFLLECGISEQTANIYSSVMQLVQMIIMLTLSKIADKISNIIRAVAVSFFTAIPLIVLLVIMSFSFGVSVRLTTVLLFVSGIIFSIGYALLQILYLMLPYHIMNIEVYGRVTSVAGAISGVCSLLFSVLLPFLQSGFGYFGTMTGCYIFSLVLVFFAVSVSMKKIDTAASDGQNRSIGKINLFAYKPFRVLLIPNLLRGFCFGIINLAVTIGYYQGVLEVNSASVLVIITYAIMIIGCAVYPFISARLGEYRMILISSIGTVTCMPLMFLDGSSFCYLLFYGIVYFFTNLINYAIPVAVTQIVDYDVVGQYSAWRMLVNTLGIALAGFVCTYMLDMFGSVWTMLISGVSQLISGIVYYCYMKKCLE